jgi:hypothetical protein
MHPGSQIPSYLVTGVIIALLFAFRVRRMSKPRRLRLELIWVLPAILTLSTAALLIQLPPRGLEWAWLGAAFVLGGALGWVRGSLIPITVDPGTHLLNTRTSPGALAFLLVLFLVRFGARALLMKEASSLHIATALLTDGFVVLATGLFAVSRLEMWLRARRLLAQARSPGLGAAAVSP